MASTAPKKGTGGKKRQPKKQKYDHQRASDVKPEPITYLEALGGDKLPRGMITLLAGRPDQGKSLLTALVASETTQGKIDADGVAVGSDVIFSNLEDSVTHVVRPRLEAAGADLEKVHFFHPFLPKDTGKLREKIEEVNAKLVILDPVAAHLGVSIYHDQEVRKALTPLTKVASETGCSMILIHHTVKKVSKNAHPLASIGGSGGGLPGAARVIYIFGINPESDDERVLLPIKFNIAAQPKGASFEVDEVTSKYAGKVIKTGRLNLLDDQVDVSSGLITKVLTAEGEAALSAEKRAIAAEFLTELLLDGQKNVADIRTAATVEAIAWRTLRRAAEEIAVVKTPHYVKGKKGVDHWTWELPPDHPALLSMDEPL